jgi:hypothetical protein
MIGLVEESKLDTCQTRTNILPAISVPAKREQFFKTQNRN